MTTPNDDPFAKIDEAAKSDPDPGIDLEERELCSDGNCTGIIGPDGRCKVCGRPAAFKVPGEKPAAVRESDAERAATGEDEPPAAVPQPLSDIEKRELCSDGNCVGVIGDDGHCKVCGAPAEPAEGA